METLTLRLTAMALLLLACQATSATLTCANDHTTPTKTDASWDTVAYWTTNVRLTCTLKTKTGDAVAGKVTFFNKENNGSFEADCDGDPNQFSYSFPKASTNLISVTATVPAGASIVENVQIDKGTSPATYDQDFTFTNDQPPSELSITYQDKIAVTGNNQAPITAELISASSGNGTISLTPDKTSDSEGVLSSGNNKLSWVPDNSPAWDLKKWDLTVGQAYGIVVNT